MRRIAEGPASKTAAGMVCLLFTLSFIVGPAVTSVVAQESEVKYKAIPVVVLDFQNVSDRGDPLLGRKAADALAVTLDPDSYEVIDRSTVQGYLADLRLTLPLDADSQMRLGRTLNKAGVSVYAIITGEVRKARVVAGPRGAEGDVTLAVLMRDLSTGEYVNGALQEARSSPKPGYAGNEDALINEALTTVADKCVLTMRTQKVREAAVMVVRRDAAVLNAGIRDGLKSGMTMVVMRAREKTGYLRLTRVDEKHSEATVLENISGVQERDKATAIYQLPEAPQVQFGEVPSSKRHRARFGKGGLWGIIAAAAALALLNGGGGKSSGDSATTGVVATSLATAALVGAALTVGANLITWDGPSSGSSDLLAYIIYRDNVPLWIVSPREPGSNKFMDPLSLPFTPTGAEDVTVTITIDPDTGVVTAFDRTIETRDLETDPNPPTPTITAADQTFEATFGVPVPVAGMHYTYRIQRVARFATLTPSTSAAPPAAAEAGSRAEQLGTRVYKIKADSPFSAFAGPATMLAPPSLVQPISSATVLNPAAVEFKFTASAGADEYVLQISRDSTFTPTQTVELSAFQGLAPGGQAKSKIVDVASLFPGTGTQVLYWRIGARFTGDQAAPRIQPGWSRTQDAGHVWSQPTTFTMTVASPAPPTRDGFTRPLRVR